MLKKIILSCTMLASTVGIAMADPVPYIGINTGVTTNTTNNLGNGRSGSFRGVPLNIFVGYGGIVNQSLYLAAEIFGTPQTADITNNGAKSTYGYGASIIPGTMLSDHTLAFARIGVIRSHFTRPGNMATGGQFGVGMQSSLTQNVDVRGEYDFGAFRSVGGLKSPRQDAFNVGLVYKFE